MTGYFVGEIEQGIDGTGIKAGIVKVATDLDGVTPVVERALRAAARHRCSIYRQREAARHVSA